MATVFEIFDKEFGKRKTGYFFGGMDMYTLRDGSNQRVIRVTWPERNVKYPTHEDYVKALRKQRNASRNGFYCPAGREWVFHNQLFPYTEQGFEAALKFHDALEPKFEAYIHWND